MAKKSLRERLAEQRTQIAEGNKGGYKIFIFKVGEVRMRALPVPEDTEFAVEVGYIFLSKELGGIVSPSSWGNKCAFMEAHLKLAASKDPKDQAIAKKLKPKRKFMMPSVRYLDLKGSAIDIEAGAKLALLTGGQYQDAIDLYLDEDEAGDFTDPKTGYDLKFGRTGTGQFDTEYTVRPCKPTKLEKPYSKEVYDPTKMAKELTPTYEVTVEMLEKYLNLSPDDDKEEEAPKKKKKSKDKDKKKKKNSGKGEDLPF